MTHPTVLVVPDPGLGNNAYLVDLGDGRALAVDACRDLRALRRTADAAGLQVAYAADTHLHADFLTGALQLAASDGALVLASMDGRRDFPHRALVDGDEVDLGGLTIRVLATPGHTDDHVAFLLLDDARPVGVFSGGSLIAGSAARTDLVDPARTEELARAQYRSVQRLAALPAETALYPTHGGGSFCSTGAVAGATSTIGEEVAANRLLAAADEDAFVATLLGGAGSFPPYFRLLGEVNRRGPDLLPDRLPLPPVAAEQAASMAREGAVIVDARPIADVAAGHPTGALSIALRGGFASWLGWLVPPEVPVIVLRNDDQDRDQLCWEAAKIGYALAGEIAGGFRAWRASGLPVSTIPLVPPRADGTRVVDVRQRAEYDAGHVPGAEHVELGSIAARAGELGPGPITVMCGHGERAMSGATVLARAGVTDVRVVDGGPGQWR